MDYYLALPPELGISPEDFAKIWNDTPECREAGEARVEDASASTFDPGFVAATLIGFVLGVAGNAVYDLIKKAIAKKGVQKRIDVRQIEQPYGKNLIVVTIIDE